MPPRPLPDGDVIRRLRQLTDWRLAKGSLTRTLEFSSFAEAMRFVNRIAEAAEEMDHHPDMTISYRRVDLRLSSHDAGGVTERDLQLAGKISAIASGASEATE